MNACIPGNGNFTTLMSVGGNPSYHKAEFVDLSGRRPYCPLVADHPVMFGQVGTWLDQAPLVCGGGHPITSACYSYNIQVRDEGLVVNIKSTTKYCMKQW